VHLINSLGKLGEYTVGACFVMEVDGHHGFEVAFLGDKAQVLDFRISLIDADGKTFGSHFNLQVKARRAPPLDRPIQVGFTLAEVARASAMNVPLFVAVIEELPRRKTKVWIKAVVDPTVGVDSIQRKHSLNSNATLKKLYGEVMAHFTGVAGQTSKSSLI